MKTRAWIIFGLLALIVALPMVLRRQTATTSSRKADDTLVILSPHNESIRQEFGEAFAAHWKKATGRSIHIDWRTPGGTSEIRMVLDAGFKAADDSGRDGIGVDVFFGGGEPDFASQAKKGRLVPLRVFETHPELFAKDGPIPRPSPASATIRRITCGWAPACRSSASVTIRMCSSAWEFRNPHPGTTSAIRNTPARSPWRIRRRAARSPAPSSCWCRRKCSARVTAPGAVRDEALDSGWTAGLQLIQRMAANARYFTDSASKIPQDVGQGNASAGMCIDFYGRSFAEELTSKSGDPRVVWIAPVGGTTLSADPVAVLKGADARRGGAGVRGVLSQHRGAEPCGSANPALPAGRSAAPCIARRSAGTCTRRKTSPTRRCPTPSPYDDPGNFTYQRELTGASFNTLRQLVKIMCIDSHEEMKTAWLALRDAGMPADALAVFSDVSIMDYAKAGKGDPVLDGPDALKAADRASEIGEWFRANYRKAEAMARAKSSTATTR